MISFLHISYSNKNDFVFLNEELFKMNNLSRVIDRLSRIYTVLTALDIRDETMHLFLGPYHISLGPAVFAALHFKNASAALLVSSRSTIPRGGDDVQRRKRRREMVIRRFRRAVRKVTLVKSILNQLQSPSVLTPFNQYELKKHGIYDLVLAGRIQDNDQIFDNDEFRHHLSRGDSIYYPGERNPLLASNFVKIHHLLNLLSSAQQQSSILENSAAQQPKSIQIKSIEKSLHSTNRNEVDTLINSTATSHSIHRQTSPLISFPIQDSASPRTSQQSLLRLHLSQNNNPNLLKNPSILSRQSTVSDER